MNNVLNNTIDTVVLFSNTSPFLDILAVSNWNYTLKDFGETSSACAYAAGVVACLQSAAKDMLGRYLMPNEIREILIETGDYKTDSRVDIIKPQINLDRAIDSLAGDCKAFWIYNDGPGLLKIYNITTLKNNNWLSFWPSVPFVIGSGGSQKICVEAEGYSCGLKDKLQIFSNDPMNNPITVSVNIMPYIDVNEMNPNGFSLLLWNWLCEN